MGSGNTFKPTLALIHGWGLGAAVWQPIAERLAGRFDLRLFDLPGYTDTPGVQASFLQTAEAINAELPDGAIVCGWSLGAMLAMQIAQIPSARLGGLILVGGTPCFRQQDDWPHGQPPALLDSFCQAVAQNAGTTRQRFIALFNQGDSAARALTRDMTKLLATNHAPATDTLLAGLYWLRDLDLRRQLTTITVPTLIVHGKNDPLMPLAAAQYLHEQITHAQLEVFDAAAHAPFAHDPDRFAALLDDYCHDLAL